MWKRAYHKAAEWLAAVVYEDPWLAGGHNGLSNAEDPRKPQDPYPRVKELRETMREDGIADSVPIVMAGGVWRLDEWENWIDNPELGQIVFQFGTRPLLTQESPIPPEWKARLMTLEEGDVLLHHFSPDRLLFVRGPQPVPARARGALATARSLSPRSRSATIISSSMSASAPRRISGSPRAICSTPANGMRPALPMR